MSNSGENLYTYTANNPVNLIDPDGNFWDTIIDMISIGWSLYDFILNPTWANAGWLVLDIIFALVPFLTGSSIIKAASRIDDVSNVAGYINKFDNLYDTIVIGNDMGRVTNMAFDVGGIIYDGYKPLNTLYALGKIDEITDSIRYTAKIDNARFIINAVSKGKNIINVGSDGRGFYRMMKSSYGLELKILYRLRYGNKIHQAWWLSNTGRRLMW
jgi:hypothetical protein